VKPVVIAVVLQALWGLGRSAVKMPALAVLGAGAVIATALGVHELVVLLGAAVAAGAAQLAPRTPGADATPALIPLGPSLAGVGAAAGSMAVAAPLWVLFVTFAKIGAVLFGSGYVLLAFLRADFMERLGWLTERQLLDAVAVGQVKPGPFFTTATFVGFVTAGGAGAAVATVGIFLPAFVFVALSGPLIPWLRRSAVAGAALDGVNVASLGLMAVVTWQLGRAAVVSLPTAGIAVAALVLLFALRVNSAWLILGGAQLGLLLPR